MQILRQTLDRDADCVAARIYLGLCYVMQGKRDEAITEFLKVDTVLPNNPDAIGPLGYAYGLSGKREDARCQAQLIEISKTRHVSGFNLSAVPSGLGQTGEAMKWLERCFDERDPSIRGSKDRSLVRYRAE